MIHSKLKLLIVSLLLISGNSFAQDKSMLSLDRIFNSREFNSKFFGAIRWIDGGDSYTSVERSKTVKGGFDIVQYETKTAKRKILVSSEKLKPKGADKALYISNYIWSEDKTKLLIFTNTRKVWRYHTRGDYWVLNLKTGKLQQIGKSLKATTLMFAKFSPNSKQVAYVSENNIYVENLKSGKIKALTRSGSRSIVNGTSDWVYEEEFGLRDGFRWSPDSKHIAYWNFDTSGTGVFYLINNTDSLYSKPVPFPYPKVGTQNSACRVGVVNVESAETTWFKTNADLRMNYIPKMEWAANSDEVMIQQMNRLQNTNNVLLGSVKDGSTKRILKEVDEAWIDVTDDLKWLKGGKYFTWLSDRDGWRHLYLVSRDGKSIDLRSEGKFDIVSILKIDEQSGWVYYIASPKNATERYLFRLSLFGEKKIEQITPSSYKGTSRYYLSPNLNWAIHYFSNVSTPNRISLIKLQTHKEERLLEDNKELKAKYESLAKNDMEFFKVKNDDGLDMDAWMIKPPNFDAKKKYPLFFYVYGEPAGQTVLNRWAGKRGLWFQMLAQKGYVVVSVDNRGTPGPKGRAWRKSIYEKIGILAPIDQAAATRNILKNYSFLDKNRIGIWGWSGGGQMTLNAMFKYPDLYKVGMAIAFVSDQRLYDTIYQERFMGLPKDNVVGYRDGSPINFAKNLKGKLLIVHGTGDDNVHYQSFERLTNELILHNKEFSMMVYPNRTHSISEGKNTSRHLYRLLTNYLLNNLEAGAK
jgi:dipeptidyl-peptidase-4